MTDFSRRGGVWRAVLLVLALAGVAGGVLWRRQVSAASPAAFVGRQTCAICHQVEARAWQGSDHDWAMEAPTPETVLGDFSGATFEHFGRTTRFFRQDGAYWVNTEGPDGGAQDYPIKYTFGYRPLQQYLIERPGGRLQALGIAWDVGGGRWFALYPDEPHPPGDPLHWTGRLQNWNFMCADCHSTHVQRNYDLATDSYRTAFTEMDVSCEACHGPGSAHVRWARAGRLGRWLEGGGRRGLRTTLRGAGQLNACFPCHSRRQTLSADFIAGAPFFDHYLPEPLREGLYYPDGQILDEVYEYGSFTQSKMSRAGVVCADCHDPHSTRLRQSDNGLCTRCHAAATYDTTAHHGHPPDAAGARCVECHMPTRTYMVIDVRRDHSLRAPRPDVSARVGTPDPCTACHRDREPAWAATTIAGWHGATRAGAPPAADAIAAGRAGRPEAEASLIELAGDTARPAVVRATAVLLLSGYGSTAAGDAVRLAVGDPSPLVRAATTDALERAAPAVRLAALGPLLGDSARAVRIRAARVLAAARGDVRDPPLLQALDSAIAEFVASQTAVADQPWAHLNLSVLYENLGHPRDAETELRTALRLDARFAPAMLNLGTLLNTQGRNAEAEQTLRAAVRLEPDMPEMRYSLGLLLAELAGDDSARMAEAAGELERAAVLLSANARAQYNAGLAWQRAGRPAEAERRLQGALALDPQSRDFLFAAATFYAQRGERDRAAGYVEQILRRDPYDGDAQGLLRALREPPARP